MVSTQWQENQFSFRGKLSIKSMKRNLERVERFDKFELTMDISATYKNPFDSEEISIEAHFSPPEGEELITPGFYYQNYSRQLSNNKEHLTLKGKPCWKIRFTPTQLGTYRYYVSVKDRSGFINSKEEKFEVLPSKKSGFVRVSSKDHRYFEFDDGNPYFAIGHNTCTGSGGCVPQVDPGKQTTYMYDRYFIKMAENKENYTRVWTIGKLGVEWEKIGVYNLENSYKYDYIMELARKKGIYILFCFHWLRNLSGIVNYGGRHEEVPPVLEGGSPFSIDKGGPCKNMSEVFTLPEAKKYHKRLIRYMVARWGYSTSILAWEFWNEIHCVEEYNPKNIRMWTKEMAQYLRGIDPWKHLITISIVDSEMWNLPEIDYVQNHNYWNPALPLTRLRGRDMAKLALWGIERRSGFKKPVIFSEIGLASMGWGESPLLALDKEGLHMHNSLWASALSGSAGTAMFWWWHYIDSNNLYTLFRPLALFLEGISWTTANFQKIRAKLDERMDEKQRDTVRIVGLQNDILALLWVQNRKNTWWNRYILGMEPQFIPKGNLIISNLKDGSYQIEWWNTRKGKVDIIQEIYAKGGKLLLDLPSGCTDIACKIKKKNF